MERNLPGVFNAAGLMVPEPSTMLPPIPFIEVEAGMEEVVEYMAVESAGCEGGRGTTVSLVSRSRPRSWARSAPAAEVFGRQ